MRLLGKRDKESEVSPPPLLVDPPGGFAAPAIEPPSAPPEVCSKCGSPFFWEDVAGRIHCQGCEKVPAVRLVKDFWVIDADLMEGQHPEDTAAVFTNFRWVHRDPFQSRWDVPSKVFAHLEAERAAASRDLPAENF